jgi:hypothetical protein
VQEVPLILPNCIYEGNGPDGVENPGMLKSNRV